jgi:outer membrane receptor protein involved in Fe transport
VEVLSMSSRRTLAGATLTPATTANVTMIVPVGPALELVGIAQNLFNVQYADPASASLQQDAIVQNGRTLRVGLSWKFRSK